MILRHKIVCPGDERNALFAPVIRLQKARLCFGSEGCSHAEP